MYAACPAQERSRLTHCLADLGLKPIEWRELSRQGFVAREQRGLCLLFKLRFRCLGKQRTRYLGTDADAAAAIAHELVLLQIGRRLRKLGHKLRVRARRRLRRAKKELGPLLEAHGYRYHGLCVRHCRAGWPGDGQRPIFPGSPTLEGESMTEDQESETIANPPPDPPGPGGGLRPKPFSSYRRQALAQSNSLLASIRLLNCDLMEIAHRYHCAVKKVIREAPPDLKKLDAVGPALQDCLQLNRQIDRYTQLDLQLQARMVPADAHA